MRRVFVLEDDQERQDWFLKRFFGHTVDIAVSVAEGLTLLKTNRYDTIFLDHDLEFHHYGSNERDDETTGYAVAGYLAQNPRKQPNALVVVHSMNPSGSRRMLDVLRDHGINARQLPFPQLKRAPITM